VKTLLVVGLIGLALLIMVLTVVGVHLNETRKIRQRLGKSEAHPDTQMLMNHIDDQQERTRAHISAQLDTKDHNERTAQGLGYEILAKIDALIKVLNDFVRGVK
jgi:CHASE1-domain containing sensor protein